MPARSAASVAAFAAASVVAGYFGYLSMFTGFGYYDDEGFMLVALRAFLSGQALYDKVVVQYGPFYFEFFGLFGALGVPFDHDSGRLVTLGIWLAIALLAGVAVFAFTCNLALGLSTYLVTFATASFAGEPMHPAGLVCLLVIGIGASALISAGRGSGPWPFILMGALTAAAILTKINVGAFAAISVALACVLTFASLARNWPIRLAASALFLVVPFLLMRADLGQPWAQRFAFHVAICALALILATSTSNPDPDRRRSELGWLVAGGAVLMVVVLAVAMFRGSSLNDLLNGLLFYPLNQRGAFEVPLSVGTTEMLWDAVGLGGAFLWARYRSARRPSVVIEGGVRVAAGLAIWVTLLGGLHIPGLVDLNSLVLPAALAWVVAAPRGRPDGGYEKLDFARGLVPALAILQTLHAFPVAGSQIGWAALAFVPVGAICIADGLAQLRLQLATSLLFLTLAVSWLPTNWHDVQVRYDEKIPLGLPGASLVRVPTGQAMLLRQITQSIRDQCDTFISVPGVDSFYIFGQLQPPSPVPTRWMWLIGDAPHLKAVIAASDHINRLCIIENDYLILAWSQGRDVTGPLDAYIQANFRPSYSVDHYVILTRAS